MTASTVRLEGVLAVVREVKGPLPVMPRDSEDRLTTRQREVLDHLRLVFADGFAHLTMAEMAAEAACSLRTLYELASGKDELVRIVVDRHLWGIGRTAMAAIDDEMAPLDAIRAHLRAAHVAVADTTEAFAADADADPGTKAISAAHARYLEDVTRALLDEAVVRGDVADVDTAAVARVMANVGADLAGPAVLPTLRTDPKVAADTVVDLILRGLTRRPPHPNTGTAPSRRIEAHVVDR